MASCTQGATGKSISATHKGMTSEAASSHLTERVPMREGSWSKLNDVGIGWLFLIAVNNDFAHLTIDLDLARGRILD